MNFHPFWKIGCSMPTTAGRTSSDAGIGWHWIRSISTRPWIWSKNSEIRKNSMNEATPNNWIRMLCSPHWSNRRSTSKGLLSAQWTGCFILQPQPSQREGTSIQLSWRSSTASGVKIQQAESSASTTPRWQWMNRRERSTSSWQLTWSSAGMMTVEPLSWSSGLWCSCRISTTTSGGLSTRRSRGSMRGW